MKELKSFGIQTNNVRLGQLCGRSTLNLYSVRMSALADMSRRELMFIPWV